MILTPSQQTQWRTLLDLIDVREAEMLEARIVTQPLNETQKSTLALALMLKLERSLRGLHDENS